MTYQQLLEQLQQLPQERLQDTVTVLDPYESEYIAVFDTNTADPAVNDVLDEGHFFLILKA
jgi:hypothetical protein